MPWPPEDADIETGQWTPDDLRVGDLVFGQKADGALARLCELADEPWLHVGSVVEDDGELKVIEIRGDEFLLSELSFFFSPRRYYRWGAARLKLHADCVESANDWMRAHLQGGDRAKHVYAWDDLVLAGVISASQRGLFARFPTEVRSAIAVAGAYCKESLKYRTQTSLTCSGFVQIAYDVAGGECAIEHPRWRSEPVSWPDRSPNIDEVFEMTEAELVGYDDVSALDLYLDAEGIDRGAETTRPRLGHVGEGLKVLAAAVAGFAIGDPLPDGLGVDSRWVTPGDLWRSPSVLERAYVTPPEPAD